MPQLVVLVTFSSRSGRTETLALSHAVGAVQARALIRLRRVADADPTSGSDREHQRMLKEYVVPTEADLLGADAIAIAPRPGTTPASQEWTDYFALLGRLGAQGKLTGKVACVVQTGDAATALAFGNALLSAGLVVVPPVAGATAADPAAATAHGQRLTTAAKALKSALASVQ
jgi:hypothetical protein